SRRRIEVVNAVAIGARPDHALLVLMDGLDLGVEKGQTNEIIFFPIVFEHSFPRADQNIIVPGLIKGDYEITVEGGGFFTRIVMPDDLPGADVHDIETV